MADFDRESMLEMFSFEMSQLVEQLEQTIIQSESGYTLDQVNEIFRIMHTIKGSAAMMMFDSISTTAHSMEDLFYFLREENPQNVDYSQLTDVVLQGMDFIKLELDKIQNSQEADGDGSGIIQRNKVYLKELKGEESKPTATSQSPKTQPVSVPGEHYYSAKVFFEDGCEMENIRAFTIVHNLEGKIDQVSHIPEDVISEDSIDFIRKKGFVLNFASKADYNEINEALLQTIYLKDLTLEELLSYKPATMGKATRFKALIRFDEGTEMENVRAYALVQNLREKTDNLTHVPINIIDEGSIDAIRKDGFTIEFDSFMSYDQMMDALSCTVYLKELNLEIINLTGDNATNTTVETHVELSTPEANLSENPLAKTAPQETVAKKPTQQHVISVNVSKLDQLLNLMGELVIAEAMVTQNPELDKCELESFHKEAIQLRKIITDVQDTVMSMRMVPLSTTFFKMHRIVRDMCKQLEKDVNLEIIGEETEVDKNIIEHISDPLMHIIRNSIDHGIETKEGRAEAGKQQKGNVLLEAKNSGGDVLIIIKDDGAGLKKDKILQKAKNNGLLKKPENEYTDKEIHQFIFLPGFSTNEKVTSYSGRGVGMDVVSTNLEVVGGSVIVDSTPGEGSTFTLKIPLTLAIIDGMTIKMGGEKYTIPIISIKQSFKAQKKDVFSDPDGNEMIMVRGEAYNVVRLYEFFNVTSDVDDIEDGIMIMLENGESTLCVLADELIGEQQVVVKTMPKYVKKIRGISGCTLLGNGDISLIIDVVAFFN